MKTEIVVQVCICRDSLLVRWKKMFSLKHPFSQNMLFIVLVNSNMILFKKCEIISHGMLLFSTKQCFSSIPLLLRVTFIIKFHVSFAKWRLLTFLEALTRFSVSQETFLLHSWYMIWWTNIPLNAIWECQSIKTRQNAVCIVFNLRMQIKASYIFCAKQTF